MNFPLVKNLAYLTVAEAFSKVVTFASFAYLARLFGPAGYGVLEWSATTVMCASLIVDQGFSSYGAREIAKRPAETDRLVAEVVTVRFILAAFAYFAVAVFAYLYARESSLGGLLLIYGVSLWALPLMLQWVFQGHDRMNLVGIIQIVRQTVFVITVFVFVRGTDDLLWVGIAEVAGVSSAALLSVWLYRRFLGGRFSTPKITTKVFREATPIGLSQMFWVLKMFGATFIVGLVATTEETGHFAAAMRIYIALHTFVWLYFFNLLPSFSRAWVESPDRLASMIEHSIRKVAFVSLFVGVIWIASARSVMTIAFGSNFLMGATALRWLAGAFIAAALSGHFRYGLIAAGRQRDEMYATAASAIMAVVLIPVGYFFWGGAGAGAALFAAEFAVLISTWLLARRHLVGLIEGKMSGSEPILSTFR